MVAGEAVIVVGMMAMVEVLDVVVVLTDAEKKSASIFKLQQKTNMVHQN